MEPQANESQSVIAPLKEVTPLSKYLAMTLFIILPFAGGWIGYTLALEKVIELDRTPKESFVESVATTSRDLVSPESVEISDDSSVSVSFQKVVGWITYAMTDEEWEKGEGIFYTNTFDSINLSNRTIYTHEAGFDPTRVEIRRVDDTIDNVLTRLSEDTMFSITTSEHVVIPSEYSIQKILKVTRSVTTNDCKRITYLHEITQSTTGVVEVATCPTHAEGYDGTKVMVAESVRFSLRQ